jgi:undecaprenyl diphosphate synthase
MNNQSNGVPQSIGVIMDGNRRWAKEKGVPILEGHRAGLEKIKEVLEWALDVGVKEVTVYAFSTENWNRSEEEVKQFMGLIEFAFATWIDEIIEKDTKVRLIGQFDRMTESAQKKIAEVTERTKDGKNGTLVIALSYGGRAEILSAVNKLLLMEREVVTEEELRNAMWSAGLLDPDLIIRTGGEKRLSNFLTWQSTYSELFFTETKWPAFSREEFDSILAEFAERERRHGK